jgi:hypothetical protein
VRAAVGRPLPSATARGIDCDKFCCDTACRNALTMFPSASWQPPSIGFWGGPPVLPGRGPKGLSLTDTANDCRRTFCSAGLDHRDRSLHHWRRRRRHHARAEICRCAVSRRRPRERRHGVGCGDPTTLRRPEYRRVVSGFDNVTAAVFWRDNQSLGRVVSAARRDRL